VAVPFKFVRDGKDVDITITVGTRPKPQQQVPPQRQE
jgi:hypothetical protein